VDRTQREALAKILRFGFRQTLPTETGMVLYHDVREVGLPVTWEEFGPQTVKACQELLRTKSLNKRNAGAVKIRNARATMNAAEQRKAVATRRNRIEEIRRQAIQRERNYRFYDRMMRAVPSGGR